MSLWEFLQDERQRAWLCHHSASPLHVICSMGRARLLDQYLQRFGARDVASPDSRGRTPLFKAILSLCHLCLCVMRRVKLREERLGVERLALERLAVEGWLLTARRLVLQGASLTGGRHPSPALLLAHSLHHVITVLQQQQPQAVESWQSLCFLLDSGVLLHTTVASAALRALENETNEMPSASTSCLQQNAPRLRRVLVEKLRNPPSLQHLCFVAIRSSLRGDWVRAASTLPLPELLKGFVCKSDVIWASLGMDEVQQNPA